MNDYISREAARPDAICEGVSCQECPFCKYPIYGGCRVDDYIKAVPAADVVEVVRCRDCRYRDPEDKKCDSGELERAGCIFPVDDDYFCAYGKRKDGGRDDV